MEHRQKDASGLKSRIVYHDPTAMLAWASAHMGYGSRPFQFRADAHAIGHEKDGQLVAVVVFDTWSDGDCLIHVVSDGSKRWFSKEFVIRAMAYPFTQVSNRRLTAIVSERNEPSIAMCRKFGFTVEGRLRRAGPAGEDLVLFGLLREECRWIDARWTSIVRHAA